MEAINTLASSAAKTIWGDNAQKQNEEPVSGKQGDTSKGEPYDAGNIEPTETSTDTTSTTTKADGPTQTGDITTDDSKSDDPKADDGLNPAKAKDSSNMSGDSTKAQNDTRSPDDDKATIPADKLKGAGPRPVAELAKARGGDAGAVGGDNIKSSGMLEGTDAPAPNPATSGKGVGEAPAKKTEGPGADTETKDQEKSKEEDGTGEQYVKSSGLNADGGDFDATNPGAGREAERLLEEKGIHHTPGKKPEPAVEATTSGHGHSSAAHEATSPEPKEKKSLSERIKTKLHHNKASS